MKSIIPLCACVIMCLAQPINKGQTLRLPSTTSAFAVTTAQTALGTVAETEHKAACATWPCAAVERRVGLKGKQTFPSFKRGILECVEESKVSPQLVLQVTSGNWSVREEFRLKMWAMCLLLKSKMMSKEGVFHLDVALSGVPDKDKPVVEKTIDECLFSKLHKPEETAWHFLKCYHQNKPNHSFL